MEEFDLVFVHGWSVTDTDTYGGLPLRLTNEAQRYGLNLRRHDIVLGRYISFHDEVQVGDLARAMQAAVEDLGLGQQRRFLCITHSTGGPVVRAWYQTYYAARAKRCPMSHLVMLAPANFGSALAQLGKGRISHLKSWFQGVEPGQGVLDWLELGSPEAWELNKQWILEGETEVGARGLWPFVISGQAIDRKLYDNLNSYTGEDGSDGVVRLAAANLNATYISLKPKSDTKQHDALQVEQIETAPQVPMKVAAKRAHSGKDIGIMRSVKVRSNRDSAENQDTVDAILRCFSVRNKTQYKKLYREFDQENQAQQQAEQVERSPRFITRRRFIHDRYVQVIFRLHDSEDQPLNDFDLLMSAQKFNPNTLPVGFFKDRQRNSRHPSTMTYYLNYDVMSGCPAIPGVREALPGCQQLGVEVDARPNDGFVRLMNARLAATETVYDAVIKPNQTVLVDIEITRKVDKEAFRLQRTHRSRSFKRSKPSGQYI